ncbi:MAG: flagellin [Sporomusaceae bacterium]|nr:flagellin [Sporomusaceae bacterium]MDR7866334.1 flagellin [Sporomusaceae bacterium]
MIINHNIAALNTYGRLSANNAATGKSLEKLSSGLRINRAGDDAAGLAISEKMRGQIRGLDQAVRNSQDGISLIQTAEGALNETHSILQRMRELAVQSASDTNTSQDRSNIQKEIDQLVKEIDRIATTTEFNTKKLLDGSMGTLVSAATANVLANSSVNSGITTATVLTALTDKAGNTLGIVEGDVVTVSYMKNGALVTNNTTVTTTTAVEGLDTADFTFSMSSGVLDAVAANAGTAGAVYGITITVKDSTGNVKSSPTNLLSSFQQTSAAKDARNDGQATILIGANTGQSLNVDIETMKAGSLGVSGLKVDTQGAANVAISVLDTAIQTVSAERSKLGANQNRLEHTINNLSTSSENLTAAESRVRDVDMAKEMMTFTKLNILNQAATAMLAQANQQPQGVLQLLR